MIKKRAGRRPALPIAKVYNQTTRGGQTTRGDFDKYTDTKPSVIKKELAEGQLYQMQEKHQTTREGPDKYTQTPNAREASDHKGRLAKGD